jgi:hypothetical protein
MGNTTWHEQCRLLKTARETPTENLLADALLGNERTVDSVSKLLKFVVRHCGQEGMTPGRPDLDSIVTQRFGDACSAFLAEAGVDAKTIRAIRYPNPVPGTKGFRSVLEEFEQ